MESLKSIEDDFLMVAQAAIETFGRKTQTQKACEELAELLVELQHELDGRGDEKKIAEEMADVYIVFTQLIFMLSEEGAEHYENMFIFKYERLKKRLKKVQRRRNMQH